MAKYTIEGNVNFQEELYKLLDEDSENEDELCQITGLPLKKNNVILECKHHFNYDALYKEIYKQKYVFKTYDESGLSKSDSQKMRNLKIDYFIKCPYCRNVQFTVLPFYEEEGVKEIYGINSLNKLMVPKISITGDITYPKLSYCDPNHTFTLFGTTFKYGQCCEIMNLSGDKCGHKYCAPILNTDLTYCRYHYKGGLRSYKMAEKKKIIDAKFAAKKEKENKMNERKKQLEELNVERVSKGLAPLKRLPSNIIKTITVNTLNVVEQQGQIIQQFIPEEVGCVAILKTGPNKGKKCGCKKVTTKGLCGRHDPDYGFIITTNMIPSN